MDSVDAVSHTDLVYNFLLRANNFFTVTVQPPPPNSGLPQLKVYVCGLSLAEQSYYEKSNPSLGDRGVTQDLGDTERPDVCLGTQTPSSERICAVNRNNGASSKKNG